MPMRVNSISTTEVLKLKMTEYVWLSPGAGQSPKHPAEITPGRSVSDLDNEVCSLMKRDVIDYSVVFVRFL